MEYTNMDTPDERAVARLKTWQEQTEIFLKMGFDLSELVVLNIQNRPDIPASVVPKIALTGGPDGHEHTE